MNVKLKVGDITKESIRGFMSSVTRIDQEKIMMKSRTTHQKVQVSFPLDHDVIFDDHVGVLSSTKECGLCKKMKQLNWTNTGWKKLVWDIGDEHVRNYEHMIIVSIDIIEYDVEGVGEKENGNQFLIFEAVANLFLQKWHWTSSGASTYEKQTSCSKSVMKLTNVSFKEKVIQFELYHHFHALGAGLTKEVREIRVQVDKMFGFVIFNNHTEAALSIQMGNTKSIFYGIQIKCSWGSKPTVMFQVIKSDSGDYEVNDVFEGMNMNSKEVCIIKILNLLKKKKINKIFKINGNSNKRIMSSVPFTNINWDHMDYITNFHVYEVHIIVVCEGIIHSECWNRPLSWIICYTYSFGQTTFKILVWH